MTLTHRFVRMVEAYLDGPVLPVPVDKCECMTFLLGRRQMPFCELHELQDLAEAYVHGFYCKDFSQLPPAFRQRFES